jgi:hypothetical protein
MIPYIKRAQYCCARQLYSLNTRRRGERLVLLSLAHPKRTVPSGFEVAHAKPSEIHSTDLCLAGCELSDDERDHRQQRPFESTSLQVARTAVKMPSEQGHRLYVKYVHTEMSPSRGGITKSRIMDIAPPCDGTTERSTAWERGMDRGHEC